ncbi:hypothetical protein ACPOL_1940 [Acidisarcina polymorpha]|uniref:Uncharacterized protein n=2 Tax=Acidisarcina polymorpha TaxID=2211140 RepID=A0A2Z5FY29_9BACT|nr:hypothetical protein ACPOL_1940 [Acidisarcina polymorpha]
MAAAVDAPDSNPATEKFHQDIKTAVMNGSLTIPQVKELQASLAALKESKAAQKPGAPLDLVTPYGAVSKIKAVMATVKQPDRETLEQDFQVVVANKQPTASAEPETPGKKLGKDVYLAVMRGNPTEAQVQQLQQSLNSLQSLKASGEGKLQQFRSLKQAKSEIEQTMNAGSFRPQDRQAVLDDLNALGPQGGGMRRGG